MRFLADMGVAMRIVEWLRAQGHDVKHLREEGLQQMPDSDIFLKAATESRMRKRGVFINKSSLDFRKRMAGDQRIKAET